MPTPEPQPINSGEVPAEPALRPATEPQAANGTRSVPDTNAADCACCGLDGGCRSAGRVRWLDTRGKGGRR